MYPTDVRGKVAVREFSCTSACLFFYFYLIFFNLSYHFVFMTFSWLSFFFSDLILSPPILRCFYVCMYVFVFVSVCTVHMCTHMYASTRESQQPVSSSPLYLMGFERCCHSLNLELCC